MKKIASLVTALLLAAALAVPTFAAETAAAEEGAETKTATAETTVATAEATEATEAAESKEETAQAEAATAPVEATVVTAAAVKPAFEPTQEALDAYDLYLAAMEKINKVQSIGWKGSMDMNISMGEYSEDVNMLFYLRQVMNGDNTVDMEMETDMLGESLVYYFKDDYMYMEMDGQKYKSKMGVEDIVGMLPETSALEDSQEDSFLRTVQVSETASGNTRLRFVLQLDEMTEVINSLYSEMELDASIEGLDRIICNVYIDPDGNLKSMKMSFKATIEVEGETVTANYSTNLSVISTNQYTQIFFPKDLNVYEEI